MVYDDSRQHYFQVEIVAILRYLNGFIHDDELGQLFSDHVVFKRPRLQSDVVPQIVMH